jgi:hypothetical protein
MNDRYTLNDKLKRIEPNETLCQFCNKRHSDKMDRNYFAPLFSIQDRTELIVYSSVKFKKIMIGIPRCNQCYVTHKESSFNAWGSSLVAGFVLIVLGFAILGLYGFFSMIACFVLAFVAPIFLVDFLVRRKGILTEKEGTMKDPLVRDMVIAGWSLNQPTPR